MKHPLETIKPHDQRVFFIPLLILTFLMMVITNILGKPLTTPSAPLGIISFELAFTPERAQEMINSWIPEAQLHAAFIQGLDFLFPIIYGSALALGCFMTARILQAQRKPLSAMGKTLAWGLILAAALDYLENIALVSELFGRVETPLPQVAAICAVIKFSLLFIAIAYILYGLVVWLIARDAQQPTTKF